MNIRGGVDEEEEDLDFSGGAEEDLDFRGSADEEEEDFRGGALGDKDMDSSLWKFLLEMRTLSLKLDDTSAELLFFFFFFLSISTVS